MIVELIKEMLTIAAVATVSYTAAPAARIISWTVRNALQQHCLASFCTNLIKVKNAKSQASLKSIFNVILINITRYISLYLRTLVKGIIISRLTRDQRQYRYKAQ